MALNIKDISEIIGQQIKNYGKDVIKSEDGTVITVGDGVALINGLDQAMMGELIQFPHDVYGMVLNLEEGAVGAVILGDDSLIREGDIVKRTGKVVETGVGDHLIGRVVNALGQPIDDHGVFKKVKTRPVEKLATGVMARQSVDQSLETGILTIDAAIPIGKGQRELIIGDRQTGKTTIALDTIINQKGKDVKCIYVSIGQKDSTIAQIAEKLKKYGAMDYTTIVNAGASDSAPLQFLAPYTGVTIAEEWMENGQDVLIVYDDLSKHAVAYREMSLLLRRPPGREAYPGDVFYLHSRLLERAARVNKANGGGSITALPIIETQVGDISAYIPTNVISITDGQIFLSTALFNAGIRPAIDIGLSVSRVGSSAQIKAMKQVAGTLKLELAQYYELESFSKFGSDLDETTKSVLDHGSRIIALLKQKQFSPLSQVDEVIILLAIKKRLIKWLPVQEMPEFKRELIAYFKKNEKAASLRHELKTKAAFTDELMEEMTKEIGKVVVKMTANIPDYNPDDYGSAASFKKLGK
ncbi:F-type H+-transporting ATPase subunit alpha [Entomoplasma freundtii]|uniref:ATP synthase subunit alpha n=1 Tax=Entomoplasma freundtii TaxID=74700 RepID=A0A2K8NS55_9MOLU|nr:F0F1 ATP synthase subunit alpha [Entomoplasma freundtii]ATZ16670.1 F0F1 ATP synthase subunit alpha [Entomoplasma freundtii]TDY58163.1 F-type H+-transporting ATPase subunit alpha [Entomoplasma freundtii]